MKCPHGVYNVLGNEGDASADCSICNPILVNADDVEVKEVESTAGRILVLTRKD